MKNGCDRLLKGHLELKQIFKMENTEGGLQEVVKKIVDSFAALNEDELYADSEKDLRELLEQSKKR